jgi:transmembrane sensor
MTHTERMEDLVAAERAAEWLQRLERGGPEVHAEFVRWLRESPRNVREILLASAVRHALKDWNSVCPSKVTQIRAKVEHPIVQLELPGPRASTRHRARKLSGGLISMAFGWHRSAIRGGWRLAAVFAFVAVLSFSAIAIYAVSDRTITTAAGEWRNIPLDDGSLLRAGPRTKLSVDLTARRRLVRLAHGELMVHVAHDGARPFYVETDLATARAVGTAFAVRLVVPGRAFVTVQEGIVAVSRGRATISDDLPLGAVKVNAGQGLTVWSDRQALVPHPLDVKRDLAWVQEQLVLGANATIADGVRELNLRNRTQIKLLDSSLRDRPMRGVFSASDPEAFAAALEHSLSVSVVKENETLLVVARPDPENDSPKEN